MGIKDDAIDVQTKNEGRRRMGIIQEKSVVGDESPWAFSTATFLL